MTVDFPEIVSQVRTLHKELGALKVRTAILEQIGGSLPGEERAIRDDLFQIRGTLEIVNGSLLLIPQPRCSAKQGVLELKVMKGHSYYISTPSPSAGSQNPAFPKVSTCELQSLLGRVDQVRKEHLNLERALSGQYSIAMEERNREVLLASMRTKVLELFDNEQQLSQVKKVLNDQDGLLNSFERARWLGFVKELSEGISDQHPRADSLRKTLWGLLDKDDPLKRQAIFDDLNECVRNARVNKKQVEQLKSVVNDQYGIVSITEKERWLKLTCALLTAVPNHPDVEVLQADLRFILTTQRDNIFHELNKSIHERDLSLAQVFGSEHLGLLKSILNGQCGILRNVVEKKRWFKLADSLLTAIPDHHSDADFLRAELRSVLMKKRMQIFHDLNECVKGGFGFKREKVEQLKSILSNQYGTLSSVVEKERWYELTCALLTAIPDHHSNADFLRAELRSVLMKRRDQSFLELNTPAYTMQPTQERDFSLEQAFTMEHLGRLKSILNNQYGTLGSAAEKERWCKLTDLLLTAVPDQHPDAKFLRTELMYILTKKRTQIFVELKECVYTREEVEQLKSILNDQYGTLGSAAEKERWLKLADSILAAIPDQHPDVEFLRAELMSVLMKKRTQIFNELHASNHIMRHIYKKDLSLNQVFRVEQVEQLKSILNNQYGPLGIEEKKDWVDLKHALLTAIPNQHPHAKFLREKLESIL